MVIGYHHDSRRAGEWSMWTPIFEGMGSPTPGTHPSPGRTRSPLPGNNAQGNDLFALLSAHEGAFIVTKPHRDRTRPCGNRFWRGCARSEFSISPNPSGSAALADQPAAQRPLPSRVWRFQPDRSSTPFEGGNHLGGGTGSLHRFDPFSRRRTPLPPPRMTSARRRAFTLVEALVALAIAGRGLCRPHEQLRQHALRPFA